MRIADRCAGAATIEEGPFADAMEFDGIDVVERARALVGRDGRRAVRTPYDDCLLFTPILKHARGQTATRFGRFVP